MSTLRWFLTVLLGIAGLAIGIIAVLFLRSVAMWFCPADQIISGTCAASWYSLVEEVATCVGVAIGATAVVVLPSFVAPRNKHLVAVAAYCVGAACAISLVAMGGSSLWFPFASAITGGALALWLVSIGARGKNAA